MHWRDEGLALRTWRESNGWTQAEAARRLGVDRSHLANIESGRHRAGQDLAGAIEAMGGPPATVWCRYELPERESVPA